MHSIVLEHHIIESQVIMLAFVLRNIDIAVSAKASTRQPSRKAKHLENPLKRSLVNLKSTADHSKAGHMKTLQQYQDCSQLTAKSIIVAICPQPQLQLQSFSVM